MNRSHLMILIVSGLALASGCTFDGSALEARACETDASCEGTGFQCISGYCQKAAGVTFCDEDIDCENDLYCDGDERCQPLNPEADSFGCIAGEPPPEDDGDSCTTDICDEDNDLVAHFDDLACQCEADPDRCVVAQTCDDRDGDGAAGTGAACDSQAEDFDCDDQDDAAFPGAAETCDGADNDCDGLVDENVDNGCGGCVALDPPPGQSCGTCGQLLCDGTGGTRCDDSGQGNACTGCGTLTPGVPGASCGACGVLVCDAIDVNLTVCTNDDGQNACGACGELSDAPGTACGACGDGSWVCNADGTDVQCTGASQPTVYYRDGDRDGHGDAGDSMTVCGAPAEPYDSLSDQDCDDASPAVNPSAPESCDGEDNNCNGVIDEGADATVTFYVDGDGDGFGAGELVTACVAPSGSSDVAGDCDDNNADVHPDAMAVCNDGLDNDCTGDFSACVRTGTLATSADDAKLFDVSPNESCGAALAVGDINGDAFDDIVVGCPTKGGNDEGQALVAFGPLTADRNINRDDDMKVSGDTQQIRLGTAVAVGDLDGAGTANGANNVVVGGPGTGGVSGKVLHFPNLPGDVGEDMDALAQLVDANTDRLGTSVSLGDFNGDGNEDQAAGAPGYDNQEDDRGAVYIVEGNSGATLSTDEVQRIAGEEFENEGAGFRVLAIPDVSGDGDDDLLVSAPGHSSGRGAVYLVTDVLNHAGDLGQATAKFVGEPGVGAGSSLAVADMDGDGGIDLIVGAETGARTYLVRDLANQAGSFDLGNANAVITGTDPDGRLGASIATPDFNGDGIDDLAVGAPRDAGGKVFVFFGPLTADVNDTGADFRVTGAVGTRTGTALVTIRANDDAVDDLAIGAPATTKDNVHIFFGGGK